MNPTASTVIALADMFRRNKGLTKAGEKIFEMGLRETPETTAFISKGCFKTTDEIINTAKHRQRLEMKRAMLRAKLASRKK